jgi:branched-chain amino acid transport system substrate-binding protein
MIQTVRRNILKGGLALGASLVAPAIVRAQPAPIRVGVCVQLSGVQAQRGEAMIAGINVALAMIEKSGGIGGRKIETVVRDDKGTGVGAVAALRDLNNEGINILIGGIGSVPAVAIVPLLQDLNSVCIGTASVLSLTHENYSKYFFRLHPHAGMLFRGLGKVVGERFPDIKEWASISYDVESGRASVRAFEKGLRSTSKTEVNFAPGIYTSLQATDFKVELQNLMSSQVEGLYLSIFDAHAITFLQQARSIGLNDKLKVIIDGGTDLILARALKQNLPDKLWSAGNWYPNAEPSKSQPISNEAYKEYFAQTKDQHPVGQFNYGFRSMRAIAEALKKGESTQTDSVIAALEGLTFDSLTGPYSIRKEDHQGHGIAVVGNVVPAGTEPFYQVKEVITYDEGALMEAPTPGLPYVE